MFVEFFEWFCDSLATVFNTMKEFVLFDGFNFYNLSIALLAVPIIIKLIHFIMCIEDEEPFFDQPSTDKYMEQYDRKSKRRGRYRR